jgi:hypothetical protein
MASGMCQSVLEVLTFYLLGIRFGYVTPVSSEGHEHRKVKFEFNKCSLVEVKDS